MILPKELVFIKLILINFNKMCWYNNFGVDIFVQHDDYEDDEKIEVKFLEMLVTDIII